MGFLNQVSDSPIGQLLESVPVNVSFKTVFVAAGLNLNSEVAYLYY